MLQRVSGVLGNVDTDTKENTVRVFVGMSGVIVR
jgi:hypothetical protein